MASLAWLFIAAAFLMLVMVANNSWPAIWARLTGKALTLMGNPAPDEGSGNAIVSTPDENTPTELNPEPGTIVINLPPTGGNAIVTPDETLPPFVFDPNDFGGILNP